MNTILKYLGGFIGDTLGGLVRHGATTTGGALVMHGYMTSQDEQSWIGSFCFLGGIGWSMFQKYQARKAAGLPVWGGPAVVASPQPPVK